MTRKRRDEENFDNESINCCQLDVHKALIRERNAAKYEVKSLDLFSKRSCTDSYCLILFVVAVLAWITISVIVYKNGGPQKLLAPVDSTNRRCGFDKGVEDKPFVFFFDITKCLFPLENFIICNTNKVCLSKCPKKNFSSFYYLEKKAPLDFIKQNLICLDEFNKNLLINNYDDIKYAIKNGYCANWYMDSEPVVRRCLPMYVSSKVRSDAYTVIRLPEGTNVELKGVTNRLIKTGMHWAKNSEGLIHKICEDLLENWIWIIVFMCLAMFISFAYIVLMRWVSGIIVWSSMIALVSLLGFTSYYTWQKYIETKNQGKELSNSGITNFAHFGPELDVLKDDILKHEYTWLTLFIISVSCLTIIILILLFLRNRLNLAIRLIKEGSKAVSYAWSSLIFPPFPWILQILIFLQGALIFCFLIGQKIPINRIVGLNSSNCICDNSYKEGDICDIETFKTKCHNQYRGECLTANCVYSQSESEHYTIYLHLFNLLLALWCIYFVSGFSQMSLSMTFSTYYWTPKKAKLPFCIVGISILRVIQYHLGTVAFGSFLLALLNWIRVLVEFFYRYMNKNNSAIVRCIKCCCGCFLACLHKILGILTKNAYIMCAMKGTNYCTSARHAFGLIIQNVLRASILDGVTGFLFFLIKLLITATMGVLAYYFFSKPIPGMKNILENDYECEYYFAPILIVCLGTFIVSSLFFKVYSVAVDTIFLCALEDLETNDGSVEKPYAMNKDLIKIFKVKNQKPVQL